MRRLLYLFIFIVIFLGVAIAALPFIVSDESIKNTLISTIEEKTGRTLVIKGETSLSVIPALAIELSDVSLSNPKGMRTGDTLSAQRMQVKLPLLPLISGELQLDQFVLTRPQISLLKDENGQVNWDFGGGSKNTQPGANTNSGAGPALSDISLGKIKIIEGLLTYQDQQTGSSQKMSNINVDVAMTSLSSPLSITGDLVWRAEKITLAFGLENPKDFLSGEVSPLKLIATSKHISADFGGAAAMKSGPVFTGTIKASSPSTKSLIVWTGSPPPQIGGLGPFNLSSKLSYNSNVLGLQDLNFGLDTMKARGAAQVNMTGARPKISGNLSFDVIDLNPYIAGGAAAGSASSKSSGAGWSRERIDLSALRSVDAALQLKATKLIARDVKIENVNLGVALDNGRLQSTLNQFTLYGGKGSGAIVLNGQTNTPSLSSSMNLSGMNARSFLKDVSGFGKIEGTAATSYSISSTGASQYDIMKNMQGRGSFNFANGAIRGINIAQMMRNLSTNVLTGWSASDAQKTDFSTFSGSYTIKNGQLTNSDLKLLGPLVRLSGAGTVNLPGRALNYKVNPRLVASLKGQGGAADLAGLDVPIIIKGPWAKPQIYPDIAGILQNPEAAYRNLKNIGKKIDPKKGADALNDLLKGGGQSGQDGQAKDPLKSIENELKKIF